jgi:hypothetical protein
LGAGVAQLLDGSGRSLLIGMAASLRRWASAQLGLGKPAAKGRRPRIDLRPLAASLRHRETRCGFEQRLVYERLMAGHVPYARRRDLKTPAYLRLDRGERFPRLVVAPRGGDATCLFGPFRDRRAAAAARDAVQRGVPLRPCDFVFEPDPALPLGLGCVYAQVRSCAAPCLRRVGEDEYRRFAGEAAALLAEPQARPELPLPAWVARADSAALVAERLADGYLLFPVRSGAVLDDEVRTAAEPELERALLELRFAPAAPGRDDTPWLVEWLRAPRRAGAYLVVGETLKRSGSSFANALRSALAASARASPAAS